MFRLVIASAALIVAVAAGPLDSRHQHQQHPEAHATILSYENVLHDDGHYNFQYETSNGIAAHEEGLGAHAANGVYSYTGPDGVLYRVTYVADENGFRPQGEHLPTPPPTPEHVFKTLEQIRANPPKDQKDFSLEALDATIARLRQH
ncbi:cuticular protein 13, RR-1 family [Anopheles darlingi]|uniref:Cuticular protein 13, RR-1 family n=1 Tax=Anopheles darlingi TaxID=43151 RepID=W5J5T0_ANODA|nr:cuticle protein CP14.6-like [Anopheles darlingi]ETN58134.1 cuticular protein 13, RR-1 family [Anopheles darlingi]